MAPEARPVAAVLCGGGDGKRQNFFRRTVRKHVPIMRWLPEYDTEKMVADMIAGITVGLTVMPQALAYATLAGLEPQVDI